MVVIDNSVYMRWFCKDGSQHQQKYAATVNKKLIDLHTEVNDGIHASSHLMLI